MADRKNINKYYPIDYDPNKLKRVKRSKDKPLQVKVRMALPMNLTCSNCKNFMARGSKFNSRKETVTHEAYLGQNVYRFYFRCKRCFQELTIKTDPKISDYVAENNCIAGYVHHKASMEEEKLEEAEKEDLEQFDKMKALELKSLAAMREAEVGEAIDTVLTMHAQRQLIGAAELHRRALDSAIDEPLSEDEFDAEELADLHAMQQYQANRGKLTAGSDDEEDEDPVAARSRQMRERMLEQQRNNLNLPKEEAEQAHSETATENGEKNDSKSDRATADKTIVSTPSAHAPPSRVAPTLITSLKKPMVKPITSTTAKLVSAGNSSAVAVVSSAAPPTSSNTLLNKPVVKPALTTSKYRRDDDDE